MKRTVDTDSIYLDYEKAFNKVDHRLLLLKLARYRFPPFLVDWIESFLNDMRPNCGTRWDPFCAPQSD